MTSELRVDIDAKKDTAEMFLYGSIGDDFFGDGITAKMFQSELRKIGSVKAIDLRLNSPGGVVTDARAMYNLLIEHRAKVTVHIDGLAASAASFLAMAGDEIQIAEGAYFMIHNARWVTMGDAEEHRKAMNTLLTVNKTIVDTYVARTGQDRKLVQEWMNDETWFDGKEAVELGFADTLVENKQKIAACVGHGKLFNKLPTNLRPNRARLLEKMEGIKV